MVNPLSMEELHTAISRLYFETRKAANLWNEEEKKISKKKKPKKSS